jgi:hypothetical protein
MRRNCFGISGEDCISDFADEFVVEVARDELVGIDNDEGWTDVGEDLILGIALNKIP